MDKSVKGNILARRTTFANHMLSLRTASVRVVVPARTYSSKKSLSFIYCQTTEEVDIICGKLKPEITKITEIQGPENEETWKAMLDSPRVHFREPFHGKYHWKIHFKKMIDTHEMSIIRKWVTNYYGSLKTDEIFLATEELYFRMNKISLFVDNEDDILVAKLSLGQYITRVTKTVSLNKNNNKEGQHESNPLSEISRAQIGCTGS
jgi:hypothetical protein